MTSSYGHSPCWRSFHDILSNIHTLYIFSRQLKRSLILAAKIWLETMWKVSKIIYTKVFRMELNRLHPFRRGKIFVHGIFENLNVIDKNSTAICSRKYHFKPNLPVYTKLFRVENFRNFWNGSFCSLNPIIHHSLWLFAFYIHAIMSFHYSMGSLSAFEHSK